MIVTAWGCSQGPDYWSFCHVQRKMGARGMEGDISIVSLLKMYMISLLKMYMRLTCEV